MTKYLIEAIAASINNKHNEAIEKLLEILEVNERNWWAWYYLGVSYGKTGQRENSYRIMQVIAGMCPNRVINTHAQTALLVFEDAHVNTDVVAEKNASRRSA